MAVGPARILEYFCIPTKGIMSVFEGSAFLPLVVDLQKLPDHNGQVNQQHCQFQTLPESLCERDFR